MHLMSQTRANGLELLCLTVHPTNSRGNSGDKGHDDEACEASTSAMTAYSKIINPIKCPTANLPFHE